MNGQDESETGQAWQFSFMVDRIRDYAIFLTDAAGIIQTWSPAAERMKGYRPAEVIGRHFSVLYTDEDRLAQRPQRNLAAALEVGTYQEQGWRRRRDGSVFWSLIELIALYDACGRHNGFCKVTRDITDLKVLQEKLSHEHERAEATLGAIDDAVISVQPDGKVDYLNPKAEQLTGWNRSEAEGEALPGVLARLEPEQLSRDESALTSEFVSNAVEIGVMQSRNGEHRVIESNTSPIIVSGDQVGEVIVFRDVEAKLSAEKALRDADRHKDEFLAMLAHELRNPLAPVSAAAELLSMARLDEAGVRRASQVIIRQIRHMTDLVDDLLDVSRVTRGLVTINFLPQDLKGVIGDAIEQMRPAIEAKQHALKVSLPREPAHVLGDRKRLIQIFSNLLNNAAKYTPSGGEIDIRMVLEHGQLRVEVRDNGIGISPELQLDVFGLFEQAERNSDRLQGGLGIGLALVKNLSELHGGTASCASTGEGKGSCFTVTLPAIHPDGGVPERRSKTRDIPRAPQRLRILLVDDNVDAADMLSFYLQMSGYEAESTHSSMEALGLCRQGRVYDVCILDIGLPEMSGFALARAILEACVGTPPDLIALTGYGRQQDRDATAAGGFRHHLVKPVDTRRLHELLVDIARERDASAQAAGVLP